MIVSICCLEIPMPGFDGKNQVWRIVELSLRITGCKFILFVENIQILSVFCLKNMRVNCILLADVSNCNTKGAPTVVAGAVRLHFAIVKKWENGVECYHRLTVWGAVALTVWGVVALTDWGAVALTVWGQSSRTFRAGGCRCRWCGSGQSTRLAGRAWRCCRRRPPRSGTG